MKRKLYIINITSAVIVALAAFALSFHSLFRLAVSAGIPWWLAWMWPICLDFAMISAIVTALHCSASGQRHRYASFVIATSSLASIAFNIANALQLQGLWLQSAIYAVPPVALIAISEMVSMMLRHGIADVFANARQSLQSWQKQNAELQNQIAIAKTEIATLQAHSDAVQSHNAELQNEIAERDNAQLELAQMVQDRDNEIAQLQVQPAHVVVQTQPAKKRQAGYTRYCEWRESRNGDGTDKHLAAEALGMSVSSVEKHQARYNKEKNGQVH